MKNKTGRVESMRNEGCSREKKKKENNKKFREKKEANFGKEREDLEMSERI